MNALKHLYRALGVRHWIFLAAVGYHASLGILLWVKPSAEEIAALYGLTAVLQTNDPHTLGTILIVASVLAGLAVVYENTRIRFALLMSVQQAILVICMLGAFYLVFFKHYGNADLLVTLHQIGIHGAAAHHAARLFGPAYHRFTDPWLLLGAQLILITTVLAHTGAVATRSEWFSWDRG